MAIDITTETNTIDARPGGEEVRDAIISAVRKISSNAGDAEILSGTTNSPGDITIDMLVTGAEYEVLYRLTSDDVPDYTSEAPISSGYFYAKFGLGYADLYLYVLALLAAYLDLDIDIDYEIPTPAAGSLADKLGLLFTSYAEIAEAITLQDTAQPVVVKFGSSQIEEYPIAVSLLFHYTPTEFAITENGEYNVEDYVEDTVRPVWSKVTVDIPPFVGQSIHVTSNGTYETANRTPYVDVYVRVAPTHAYYNVSGNTVKASSYIRPDGIMPYNVYGDMTEFPQQGSSDTIYIVCASESSAAQPYVWNGTEYIEYDY